MFGTILPFHVVDITMQEGFSDIPAEAAWDFLGIVAPFSAQKLSAIFSWPFLFFLLDEEKSMIRPVLATLLHQDRKPGKPVSHSTPVDAMSDSDTL
jgi:hypothetical protein